MLLYHCIAFIVSRILNNSLCNKFIFPPELSFDNSKQEKDKHLYGYSDFVAWEKGQKEN